MEANECIIRDNYWNVPINEHSNLGALWTPVNITWYLAKEKQ